MRVYDLARQTGVPNKELVAHLLALGVEVKSPSSSIDDKSVRRLLERLGKAEAGSPKAQKDSTEGEQPVPSARKTTPTKPKSAPKAKPEPKPKRAEKTERRAEESEPTPPKKDARALALEAIARAKARRTQQHQQVGEAHVPAPPPAVAAPEHQKVDLAGRKPAPKPAPSAQPMKSPGPDAGAGVAGTSQQGFPSAPAATAPPEPARPRDRREPSRPVIERRAVELQQLPSLPRRRPPQHRRDESAESLPDLTAPPSIEVMKLRPARRGVAPKRLPGETAGEEARRRRSLAKHVPVGEKRIRPGRFLSIDTLEETVQGVPVSGKRPVRPRSSVLSGSVETPQRARSRSSAAVAEPKAVKLYGDMTVANLAEKIGVPASDIIAKAITLGEMLTMNKLVGSALCELLASEFGVEVEIIPEGDDLDIERLVEKPKDTLAEMKPRPPVVTVMGHVDHGKTRLLDTIRKTNVAEAEFGGITQHIGAYHVETERGEVVFLDTPGHAAFTAMRARGASVTDIVVLVVAADDGLMPQTAEAINHARAAGVPIIVAINKVDLPSANVQKVRNDLMQHSLVGEDLGGDTIICEISAKTGQGIDSLLEMILLQAEIMELQADHNARPTGVVIESEIDRQRGSAATVLVEEGVLRVGDPFVCGDVSGRVRLMLDDLGRPVEEALPAFPVEILGLDGCPQVGEMFVVLDNERQARQIAEVREERRRRKIQSEAARPHVTLEGLSEYLRRDGKPKTLNLILKADVQGSVEAVAEAITRLSTEKVNVVTLHSGVGGISESDVYLAAASDAVIIGFNVRPDAAASDLAAEEGIDIRTYRVIYELLDDLHSAMVGMLDKKYREVARGTAEVRQVFKITRLGSVAGCYVTSGEILRSDRARLVRDSVPVYDGTLNTLRRVKEDVASVQSGFECGLTLLDFQDIKEGDVIETYHLVEVEQTL